MNSDQKAAIEAARAGAAIVREGFISRPEVHLKGAVNPVTAIDHQAEEAVFEALTRLCPGEPVLGEESGGAGWDSDRVWIVDPLDGTVNFIHGIPQVAVSVAVCESGKPVAGAIVDVVGGEEFSAATGRGALLHGEPIRVSEVARLDGSLISTGFPYDRQERAQAYTDVVAAVLQQAQGVRRIGSAALDLAWVACGRFEGHWEFALGPWDVAAGVLLVTEAGGMVTDHRGEPFALDRSTLVASNGQIHEGLRSIVEAHLPAHLG